MLYQERGIRDSSRTNLVCRGSAITRAMGTLPRLPDPRRDVPPGEREPSARDDPRATDVASCSRAALPRWPAGDRPARRAGGLRPRDVDRCRGDPSSACAPFRGIPCRATLRGRAPMHGRPAACPDPPTRAPWSGSAWAGAEGAWPGAEGAWPGAASPGAGLGWRAAAWPAVGWGWPAAAGSWPDCGRPRSVPGSPRPSLASRPARTGWATVVPMQRAMAQWMVPAFACLPDHRTGEARPASGSRPERSPPASRWRRPARSGPRSRRRSRTSGRRRCLASESARTARIRTRPSPGRG